MSDISDSDKDAICEWSDADAEKMFADAGIAGHVAFMALSSDSGSLAYQSMGEHKDKKTGEVLRSVARIDLSGRRFFLKRAWAGAFDNISAELAAINKLPEFGLTPPRLVAWRLDYDRSEGFILLDELKGFHALIDILRGKAPREAEEDLDSRKERVLEAIGAAARRIRDGGYAYPDLVAKHIFLKPGSDDLALIDLERFRPLSAFPWYFRFPVLSYFTSRKMGKKLVRSLESDMFPASILRRCL